MVGFIVGDGDGVREGIGVAVGVLVLVGWRVAVTVMVRVGVFGVADGVSSAIAARRAFANITHSSWTLAAGIATSV